MTPSPSQNLSFPGLTGESRKALDARLRPAGMTSKQQWRFRKCQFYHETVNNFRPFLSIYTFGTHCYQPDTLLGGEIFWTKKRKMAAILIPGA